MPYIQHDVFSSAHFPLRPCCFLWNPWQFWKPGRGVVGVSKNLNKTLKRKLRLFFLNLWLRELECYSCDGESLRRCVYHNRWHCPVGDIPGNLRRRWKKIKKSLLPFRAAPSWLLYRSQIGPIGVPPGRCVTVCRNCIPYVWYMWNDS